jgi:hypothetical protein
VAVVDLVLHALRLVSATSECDRANSRLLAAEEIKPCRTKDGGRNAMLALTLRLSTFGVGLGRYEYKSKRHHSREEGCNNSVSDFHVVLLSFLLTRKGMRESNSAEAVFLL